MLRRLIARLTGRPYRPNLPPLPRPARIPCLNGYARLSNEARLDLTRQRDDATRAIEIYALIGYDADGRPLPEGSRPLPRPAERPVIDRRSIRRD